MIKLAAFDFDGTLVDTFDMCIEAFQTSLLPYAGRVLSQEEIVSTFGMNEKGMIRAMIKENTEQALADFYEKYEQMHGMCDQPFEGIIELVRELKSRGIIVVLITGKGKVTCDITIKRLGIEGLFTEIRTGSEYKNAKKDALLEVMKKYGMKKEECFYVGDTLSDVISSKKAGIRCLSAAWCDSADLQTLEEHNHGNVFASVGQLREYLVSQLLS